MEAYIELIKSQMKNRRHVIITGARGSGKTTLIKRLLCELEKEQSIPGIVTWCEPGVAVYMKSTKGNERVTVGKYDPKRASAENKMKPVPGGFEVYGVSLLKELTNSSSEWVFIDEIGYLESSCREYICGLNDILEKKRVIAVVRKQSIEHITKIINREDAFVMDLDNK